MPSDSKPPSDPETSGAPTYPWTRLPRVGQVLDIVVQSDPDACGPACGAMLLADRGYRLDPKLIAETIALPCVARVLAERLSALAPPSWSGGAVDPIPASTWEFIDAVCTQAGSWAALLEPHGHRTVGHWVVIDSITAVGVVNIRDPAGAAYGIPVEEFESLWTHAILVVEAPT